MTAIAYNQDKLLYQSIFSQDELDYLEALNAHSKGEFLLTPRNIEAFSIDFAYTSARLEGNTYTPIEAEILLKTGRTANDSKRFDEALMIKNMYKAFDYVVLEASQQENKSPIQYLIKNLHTQVSEMLLDRQDCGVVRKSPVLISTSNYVPSDTPKQLEAGLDLIVSEYDKIQNVFERSVYIHQNLAYLQYFLDHNKRTARNMVAYTLLNAGKMPVIFTEKRSNEYVRAVLSYYESPVADYTEFKKYFISAYEKVCSKMNVNAIKEAKNSIAKK
ncbi:MAG: Fic family protein [Moraxella sp.]|nr:Fic family protein [Moraxella sp.]